MLLERGEWGPLNQGVGARDSSNVHFDSKAILWIFFGRNPTATVNHVWNYDIQNDLWRWVLGFNTSEQYSFWGTRGVPGPDVYPGYLRNSQSAIDKSDNIWFFGAKTGAVTNALFHYNTSSNEFTWIDGGVGSDRADEPSQGEFRIASQDVWPGPTGFGCMLRDSADNLWLVGGRPQGDDPFGSSQNAVYHYNTTSGWWSWVDGDPTGFTRTNVTAGIFGGRNGVACTIDNDDRIWLFSGSLIGTDYNDLWSYDTKTLQWQVEFEGTEEAALSIVSNNTFAAGNSPGRLDFSALIDRQDGTLMVVGGALSSQVWVWHKTNKLWKIVSGSNDISTPVYGTPRQPGSTFGTRNRMGYESGLNAGGQLVVFGGVGLFEKITNDMWIVPQDVCTIGNLKICSEDATCTYAEFYPVCTCNEGFQGDGRTCTPSKTPATAQPNSPNASNVPNENATPDSMPGTPKGQVSSARQNLISSLFGMLGLTVFCF